MLVSINLKFYVENGQDVDGAQVELLNHVREEARKFSESLPLPAGFKVGGFYSVKASTDYSDESPIHSITYDRDWLLDGMVIDDRVFDEVDYGIEERDEHIEELGRWIVEASRSGRENDLVLMRNDLEFLRSLDDEFVYSSRSTNDYVAHSIDPNRFNEICELIIEEMNSDKFTL